MVEKVLFILLLRFSFLKQSVLNVFLIHKNLDFHVSILKSLAQMFSVFELILHWQDDSFVSQEA